ncbi:endonuclease MutS2 [Merismopedia glauca]|uniref:Endonuclease MutS2 n=1 Tax=Merismopedia glauca CCAP 1448/3 TaxID=1296344 RepID=A0A2T1BXH4_9CYAN|nr:endonuclease MutS2 [Merismopedia glauca]PSB00692.1 endonuclease MutS2 [Merismopedia glauca CCAP 1448/3]
MIQAETLELLEWSRLCQHLATFSATKLGSIASEHLPLPTSQAESINLLAQTKEAYEIERRIATGLSFDGIQDIGEAIERAERHGILSGEELLAIATTLAGARKLRRAIEEHPDLLVLSELVAQLRTYPEIEQEIHRCIDERGEVADRASIKLGEVRQQLKGTRSKIYQVLQGILQRQSNAIQQPTITQRGDRFVIAVKQSHRDSIPGIVHDSSSSGATLFVEPQAIVSTGNQLRQYLKQEQIESEAIRRTLTEQIAAVKSDLEILVFVVTTIDLAITKARYSLWLEANPPRFINPEETITLRQLRHPLLVWQQVHEQGSPVVPVDLLVAPEIRVVTITGPNTGGKTVSLKTLGLAALMAKVGLFVPAREPVEIPWFDQVLADIGDEQSLEQSLSTFSGHIRRISRILTAIEPVKPTTDPPKEVDFQVESASCLLPPASCLLPTNLILLDEVGAGTDPAEGSALAIALLQYLAQQARLTLASTHYGELKALKYQDSRFENAAVEFDDVSLSPTYRLLWGIPGRSNALTIARRLGLKEEVIIKAREELGEETSEINQVISGLEAQRRRQELKAKEAANLLTQTEVLHRQLEQQAAMLKNREQELKQKQQAAVTEAIAQAKAEIAKIIRQLQQGNATAQDAQKATDTLQEIGDRYLPPSQTSKTQPNFQPKVGSKVRIPKIGQTAEVLTETNEDGEITVRFGIMKMTVSVADIESLDGQKVQSEVGAQRIAPVQKSEVKNISPNQSVSPVESAKMPTIRTERNTLDIRGMRVNEAESQLEKGIQQAINHGVLWIVHGKGTGKLREGVHVFLEQHPQIDRFELADSKEGGNGVTIAYIR